MMTRACYKVIYLAETWFSKIVLSDRAVKELIWWGNNLERVNGFPIKNVAGIECFSNAIFFAGDASAEEAFLGRIDHD